ncbi:MAG TPA: putative metal-binding motif-containing protein [Polyangiales bacterium]|nr:putative metal-binding motif-containing protein [Polyangiales bacterium]
MRSSILLSTLALALLSACSDTPCRPGELKVGSTCYDKRKADASVSEESDGGRGAQGAEVLRDAGANATGSGDAASGDVDAASAGGAGTDAATGSQDAEVSPLPTCLTDGDGDGFGVEPATAPCPAGGPPKAGDCNDSAASAFPGSTEVCDTVDNDCNGKIDDGPPEKCNGVDDDCNPATADGAGACRTFQCKNATCLATCVGDGDCVSGLHCVAGTCEGTQDGSACAKDEQCTSGSCTVANKCGAKVAVNGLCNSDGDCSATAACSSGTCKISNGQPCGDDGECKSQSCYQSCLAMKNGLNQGCNTAVDCASGLCKVSVSLCKQASGAACVSDSDCQEGICAAGSCVSGPQVLDGNCSEPADCAEGFSCAASLCKRNNGKSCSSDTECVTGACLPRDGGTYCGDKGILSTLCNSVPDCGPQLFCKVGVCLKVVGEVCAGDSECAEVCGPDRRCRWPSGWPADCAKQNDCDAHFHCVRSKCRVWTGDPCPDNCFALNQSSCPGCEGGLCELGGVDECE